jgi:TolB-like protein/Flp pilus assembly protein TadD
MSDVFVSYKAEDRRRVKPLVEALQADGFSVWWDEQIGGGAAWRHAIETELNAAKCVIVAWSNRAVGTEGTFVQDEATRAQQRHVYVPVIIDKCHLPLGFGETQALSLTSWRGDRSDPRYQAVLAAVRRNVGGKAAGKPRKRPSPLPHAQVDRRAVLAGVAVAAVAVAGVGGWALLKPSAASTSDSIAVLPFANLSGDPEQAYFSDGMAEELRSSLGRLAGLKVVGRTSSEIVRNDDAKTAAKKLAVANILIGSVRRSQATIRVTAQLIDGTSGLERWSEDYDRAPGDTIKIQTDIAESVAEALKIALGSAGSTVLTVGGTNNVDAQNLVLQADALFQSTFSEDRARQGLELIDAAIALDPNYAGAYGRRGVLLNTVSLFFSHGPAELKAGRSQAFESAKKAIALAPTLGWAHLALAQVSSGALQIAPAWTEYRQALRLAPNDANTLRLYARFLAEIGKEQQALELADEAVALDPLNAESYNFRIFVLYHARRYAEVEHASREQIARSPNLFHPPLEHGYSLIMLGQLAAARQFFAPAPTNGFDLVAGNAILLARSGDRDGALLSIAELERLIGDNASYSVAEIYAQLRDPDQAFAAIDRAFENSHWALINLLTDPFMDPVRGDRRFKAALSRLDYPS